MYICTQELATRQLLVSLAWVVYRSLNMVTGHQLAAPVFNKYVVMRL
jgi:hypothetical protein